MRDSLDLYGNQYTRFPGEKQHKYTGSVWKTFPVLSSFFPWYDRYLTGGAAAGEKREKEGMR